MGPPMANVWETARNVLQYRLMATSGRLTNAPIQEALVDLRIANTGTIDVEVLEPLKQQFRSRYPKSEPYQRVEARIEARPEHTPEVSASAVRFHGLFLI